MENLGGVATAAISPNQIQQQAPGQYQQATGQKELPNVRARAEYPVL